MFKNLAVAFIIGTALGAIIALKYKKPEVVTVEKELTKTNIVTKIVEKTLPSGEKTVETVVIDKSVKKDIVVQKAPAVKNTRVFALVSQDKHYAVGAEYRLLGPVSIMGTLSQNGNASLGLSYEF